jgi:cell division protein ZapA (FtsZ GTPase activity inhibitor)
MAMQQYEVQVFGQSFRIMSEKNEKDVHTVAAYVDHKMREQARIHKTIAPVRVAIMTALGIAEELFEKNA